MCGCSRTCQTPIFALADMAHVVARFFPTSHIDECSHHVPNHEFQEPLAADVEAIKRRARPVPQKGDFRDRCKGRRCDLPREGLGRGIGSAEGAKVVRADEVNEGGLHGGDVKCNRDMPSVRLPEGVEGGRYVEVVRVFFLDGLALRVKVRVCRLEGQDLNIRWQVCVQGPVKLEELEPGIGIEVRDLSERMDAGIGSARADEGGSHAQDFFERRFDARLHGDGVRLCLPAVVGRPMIGEGEFKAADHSVHPP